MGRMPHLWLFDVKINRGAEEAKNCHDVPSIAARISRSRSLVDKLAGSAVMAGS